MRTYFILFLSILGILFFHIESSKSQEFIGPHMIYLNPTAAGGNCCTNIGGSGGFVTSGAGSITVTYSYGAGHLLVVGCGTGGNANGVTGPSDSGGDTFTSAITGTASGDFTSGIWYTITGSSGTSVTCTTSAGRDAYTAFEEYSGQTGTTPLDATASGSSVSSKTCTTGSFTTAHAKELSFVYAEENASIISFSAGTGYTLLQSEHFGVDEHQFFTTTQSAVTASISSNKTSGTTFGWVCLVATFF